ncbi:hypothetical protein BGL34_00760 [Fructilactobacillus lindneri]|uniref:DUF1516 family protein n=2 Tax=Fructilactobacillus lindneri TaxID=53444 RepID=A0AB33BIW4_9LACO|nr:hypothetical protein AYR60_05820 [Fructilactobacillus lindneri]POH24645.1 hypothetical protein BHU33_01285 [Fructilactobacillus lindneri DSM 20690 = JCM 11027]ANZ59613.1 hypothetical protein AYR59_06075 [Fructilactobacillus lindneri]POH03991.1 hypothetical protein BGL32_01290 [Fructilactobacillus lindneri]POH04767.1 hypothetical protein BGL33_00605 [Fructilactobacillus lindneri]
MFIYLIIILWLLLIISLTIGVTRKQDKQIVKALMYTRALYFVLLMIEVVFSIQKFNQQPSLIIFSFIISIFAISFIDISFQRKIQGTLKLSIIWITIILIIIAIIILFMLKQKFV